MDSVDDSIKLSVVHKGVVLVAVADLAAARRPLDLCVGQTCTHIIDFLNRKLTTSRFQL